MHKQSLLLVFSTAIISGVSIFVNGLLVKTMSPSIFTFGKNITVAALLVALLLATKEFQGLKKLKKKQWLQLVLIGLIGGSIPFFLFFKGLSMTSGTMGAFIHKTLFVYIAAFAALFLKERLHPMWFLGALCLLAGNAMFLNVDFSTFAGAHLLILAATLFWAVENTLSKYALKDLSGNIVAAGRMGFGAMFMALYMLYTGEVGSIPAAMTQPNLIAIAMTGILLFGYVCTWYNGIKRMPVSTAACVLLLGSPITTLLGAIFTEKTVSLQYVESSGLLVLGTVFVLVAYKKSLDQPALSTA